MANFTNRQEQIIQASLDLIANSGIHGLTIKNISKEVGISEPAIYRHFESKTDILLGIISKIRKSTGVSLDSSMRETQNTTHIIQNVFMTRAKRFTNNPSMAAVIFSEEIFEDNSQLSDAIRKTMNESQSEMGKLIQQGQSKSEIANFIEADELALIIIGSFRLLVTKWHMSKNSFDLEKKTKSLFDALGKLI